MQFYPHGFPSDRLIDSGSVDGDLSVFNGVNQGERLLTADRRRSDGVGDDITTGH